MKTSRRKFLTIAGLAITGLGAKQGLGLLIGEEPAAAAPSLVAAPKRYAMIVDPAKCQKGNGCTDCIAACTKVHNIPDFGNDTQHAIKWLWKDTYAGAFDDEAETNFNTAGIVEDPILVMCNHCDNPPCVRVCPTQATWKRADDGIVTWDMHRCIGCRFCIAACPYGSRSFNWTDPRPYITEINPDFPTRTKGVVEKCNFCLERLEQGLQPACVEACPSQALVFGDLEDPNSAVRQLLGTRYTVRRKTHLGTQPQVYYITS